MIRSRYTNGVYVFIIKHLAHVCSGGYFFACRFFKFGCTFFVDLIIHITKSSEFHISQFHKVLDMIFAPAMVTDDGYPDAIICSKY